MLIDMTPQQYVNFDENGTILSIGPGKESGLNHLEVSMEKVRKLLSLEENMDDYIVKYSRRNKRYVLLKNLETETPNFFNIYKLQTKCDDYDLCLVVDKDSGILFLDVAQDLKVKEDKVFYFSFTEKNNPYSLLQGYRLTKKQRIQDDKLKQIKDFSVYCADHFETMCMEVK